MLYRHSRSWPASRMSGIRRSAVLMVDREQKNAEVTIAAIKEKRSDTSGLVGL